MTKTTPKDLTLPSPTRRGIEQKKVDSLRNPPLGYKLLAIGY
ncbi:MAG TPA: hypothetical protein VK809_12250 [Bacteroidia bacterium]|nr:hypothetical protein [Bacteroidia bacterium]